MEDEKPQPVEDEKTDEVITLLPPITCRKEEHEFSVNGMDMGMQKAECLKCPLGYLVPRGGEVKDKHIYIHGQFVI